MIPLTWAVANQKGGVGKTTTTVSLGGLLAGRGSRVLLVDLDPHGSLTAYFGHDPDALEDSVYRLFTRSAGGAPAPLASLLQRTGVEGLSLLPASSALATLDRQLSGKDGMGLVLARALAQCRGLFDHVIVDCPPVFGVLMLNALAACRTLIVPVQTEFLALKGLERLQHTLAMIARSRSAPVDYVVLPTLYDRRTRASRDSLRALERQVPDRLWRGLIPVDTLFREASRMGQPLPLVAPGTRGARAYRKFLDFMLERDPQALRRAG